MQLAMAKSEINGITKLSDKHLYINRFVKGYFSHFFYWPDAVCIIMKNPGNLENREGYVNFPFVFKSTSSNYK